jgi:hypothetical protein
VKSIELILSGVARRDNCLKRFAEACGGRLVKEWDGKSIPVVVGNLHGADDIQIECRKRPHPYIVIDHGYFNRDFNLSWARFCVNNYHCTDWRDSDRKIPKVHEWKHGDNIVVIPPSEKIAKIYNAHDWLEVITSDIKRYSDKKIVVKHKNEGRLSDVLRNAHCLVSFGSVSEVEAMIYGIPVIVSAHSPAITVSNRIENIENLVYPDRIRWLHSLVAAQWHKDEMKQCWQRIRGQLYGNNRNL